MLILIERHTTLAFGFVCGFALAWWLMLPRQSPPEPRSDKRQPQPSADFGSFDKHTPILPTKQRGAA
jgi:hypothetical protein